MYAMHNGAAVAAAPSPPLCIAYIPWYHCLPYLVTVVSIKVVGNVCSQILHKSGLVIKVGILGCAESACSENG